MCQMSQDDIKYILELLDDAINDQDWDLVQESQEYLRDFITDKPLKYIDKE